MTELQRQRVVGLKDCRLPDEWSRGFVASLTERLAGPKRNLWLTEKQNGSLGRLCWRVREQLQRNGFGHVVPAEGETKAEG